MTRLLPILLCSLSSLAPGLGQQAKSEKPPALIQVLIVDGQNNHGWLPTTSALRAILAQSGAFAVNSTMSPGRGAPRAAWNQWNPAFGKADVVVVNYNGLLWPETVRNAFEKFVSEGGGVVFVHAANNPFQGWKAYNQMIGLGWRNNKFDKRLTIDDATGKQIITPRGEGPGAGHGPQHAFMIKVRQPDHPIMKGLPPTWRHGRDELYHGQRGPAANMTVLSTAFSAKDKRGTQAHEPITWWIPFGKGRCVTTVMGHHGKRQKDHPSLHCVGFQTVLQRSVQWAARRKVTIPVPKNFPSSEVSIQAPKPR
ncbi:MAG: ThuA domain-containing protein [Planctomycetota bacterium]|nr:ThuA domain-containing protein [Planctomycetota bacterium]